MDVNRTFCSGFGQIAKMQADTARSQKIRLKWQETKQWPHCYNLSKNIQWQIRDHKRHNWQETKRVNVDNLVNDLPQDLAKEIEREMGVKMLKKVKEFENWGEEYLEYLCDFLKPVFSTERTRIVREGEPIDEMLFVLKGKLCTYMSMNHGTGASSRTARRHLKDGDFCGEELIAWAKDAESFNLPISTGTIQALTNVEAFAFMADDLKHVLRPHESFRRVAICMLSFCRFRRLMRRERKEQSREQKSQLKAALELLKHRVDALSTCNKYQRGSL